MKILKNLLIIWVGIVLACNAFLLPFQALAFSPDYYVKQFTALEVHKTIGISQDALVRVTETLVAYIDNKTTDIGLVETVNGEDVVFYNDKEQQHLHDILLLVNAARKFLLVINTLALLAVIGIFVLDKKDRHKTATSLIRAIRSAVFVTLISLGALIALYFIDFDWAFRKFHEIFFTNDLWLLDPKTDRLIQLMPLEFFIDFTAKWLSRVALIIMAFILIGFILPLLGKLRAQKRTAKY